MTIAQLLEFGRCRPDALMPAGAEAPRKPAELAGGPPSGRLRKESRFQIKAIWLKPAAKGLTGGRSLS